MGRKKKPKPSYDKSVHGKRYSEATKIAVLAMKENGESERQIALQNKVSPATVHRLLHDPELKEYAELKKDEVDKVKKALISRAYVNSLRAQSSIDEERLKKSSFVQLMVGSKIGIEMARLMEEKSTANVSHRGLIESIESDREKLMAEFQRLSEETPESESANNEDNGTISSKNSEESVDMD